MGISVRSVPKSGISGSKTSLKVSSLLSEKENILCTKERRTRDGHQPSIISPEDYKTASIGPSTSGTERNTATCPQHLFCLSHREVERGINTPITTKTHREFYFPKSKHLSDKLDHCFSFQEIILFVSAKEGREP